MSSSQAALGALTARIFLRNTVFRPRSLFVLALLALDVVLAFIYRSEEGTGGDGFRALTSEVLLGFVLPFVGLLYGTAVVRDEVEGGTITYLLTRPLTRRTLYLSRLFAAAAVVLLATVPVGLFNASLLGGVSDLPQVVLALTLGALCYTALFAGLGALLKRPFIVGLLFLLFVDLPVSEIPMAARYLTIRGNLENFAGLVEPPEGMLALLIQDVPASTSGLVVAGVGALALAVGLWAFGRREYLPDTGG